jgi:hypothetical protein
MLAGKPELMTLESTEAMIEEIFPNLPAKA